MSTITLMPARSAGSPGLRSICTRTGMRCTTFTQLPDEFCAGSTENSEPLAGAMALHRRLPDVVRISVDATSTGSPGFT